MASSNEEKVTMLNGGSDKHSNTLTADMFLLKKHSLGDITTRLEEREQNVRRSQSLQVLALEKKRMTVGHGGNVYRKYWAFL